MKSLLNIEGVKQLKKEEQHKVNGGGTVYCYWTFYGYQCYDKYDDGRIEPI